MRGCVLLFVVVALAVLAPHASGARVFAGSMNGVVYSINLTTLNSKPLLQPAVDCSHIAIRPFDGLAVCRAALGNGINAGLVTVFNIYDRTVIGTTAFNRSSFHYGPFYDEVKKNFFFLIGTPRVGVFYTVFDPFTYSLTPVKNLTYTAKDVPLDFGDFWTFYNKGRVACGTSGEASSLQTCINVDSMMITWQQQQKRPWDHVYLVSYPNFGVVLLTYSNLEKGCVGNTSGTVTAVLIDPVHGKPGKTLSILQNLNPPLCPINYAAFVLPVATVYYSMNHGYWFAPHSGDDPSFVPTTMGDFNSWVESYAIVA